MRIRCLLLLFIWSMPFARAQVPFVRDYWLNENNIPVKVNTIIQDKNTYNWVGTDEGLYRFNGRNFVHITDSISQPVTALAEGNGKIYVGYANGTVGEVVQNEVRRIKLYRQIPSTSINEILVNGDVFYLCTEEGFFVIFQNAGALFNVDNGLSDNFTYTASKSSGHTLLIGTDKGINVISNNNNNYTVKVITSANSTLRDNITRVIRPGLQENSFWIGTQNGGVQILTKDALGNTNVQKGLTNWKWGQVNDIAPYKSDKAWVATDNGFMLDVSITADSLVVVPNNVGRSIKKIMLGPVGNIWCATLQGISMLTSQYVNYIPMPNGYCVKRLTAMTIDKNNRLWYALGNKLYCLSLGTEKHQPQLITSLPGDILSLFADSSASIWAGTLKNGLWFIKDKKSVHVTGIAGIDKTSVLSITGKKDELWMASLNGVEQMKIEKQQTLKLVAHHDKQSGIGSDYVYQLYIDRSEKVWMATDGNGICMYDTTYHHWSAPTGMQSKVVYSVTEDAYATMWIGTLDKGIYFYNNNGGWFSTQKKNDAYSISVTAMSANNTGQVIAVHQKGVDEWCENSHDFRHLNKRFLPQMDSLSTVLNCTARDTAGNVYVPFNLGFMIFQNQQHEYDIRPVVHINTISVLLKPLTGPQHVFSHSQNYITIAFDGANYSSADPIHYRYRLSNYTDGWVYTDDESVTLAQLPPGNYEFRVEASLNKSFYQARAAVYAFEITAPFWTRKWFAIVVFFTIVGLVYLYTRLREKQLRRVSQLQKERMQFEYEHLKTQVNPHFLFNSLNTLASLIEEDKTIAVDYTTQLSDLYRHMLSYKDKDLVFLSEEWEIVKGYMYIQQSRFGTALSMQANIPANILQTKKIIPLSLQICVENAIKHNIVSAFMPLVIHIAAEEEQITISNKLQPKMSKEKTSGLGLVNISKRYALLTRKEISYGVKGDSFTVTLPLL